MLLAFTGKINTNAIVTAIDTLRHDYQSQNLPICVDFDHVFDPNAPRPCIARSNIDNPREHLFYVTNPSQAILNQVESRIILNGKYFSLIPCKSIAIEDSKNYANNLMLEAYIISDKEESATIVNTIKTIYDSLGVVYTCVAPEKNPESVEFIVNGIVVSKVYIHKVGESTVLTTATVIGDPIFSYALTLSIV